MGVRSYHLDRQAVRKEHVAGEAVEKGDIAKKYIQAGRTSVTFAFAATGEENQSASITFPTAFDAAPAVAAAIEGIDVGIASITVTASGFTVKVRDDKGTDYTTSQTATVNWIAVAV